MSDLEDLEIQLEHYRAELREASEANQHLWVRFRWTLDQLQKRFPPEVGESIRSDKAPEDFCLEKIDQLRANYHELRQLTVVLANIYSQDVPVTTTSMKRVMGRVVELCTAPDPVLNMEEEE